MANRKCGSFSWENRWYKKHQTKRPRYFCPNCYTPFRTGKFSRTDSNLYDDICPNCGALGLTFLELMAEYKDLSKEYNKLYDKLEEKK